MPRGSPGGGLLDPFSAFLEIRFRGRFWVICLMTRSGLGNPTGSLNLKESGYYLTVPKVLCGLAISFLGPMETAGSLNHQFYQWDLFSGVLNL